ncbi:hypothetical protein NSE01_00850 [Novosphingobium sediminis]|uniref:Uncharacterized protein n=1 Tax=Novosphingobium sediminis TaxID=707214 RepID=A0A512AF27_9SPHN|nr:hypothetical protein [Novosphingobium sediminis]GEN98252.1 hypothetical protein NSE01_00850 [Novosphingobium sediminis]
MNHSHLAIALLVVAAAAPLAAQTVVAPPNVTAGDVATAPLDTLNVRKDEIPPILIAAREDTYTVKGMRSCRAIGTEIVQLDAVLGPDIDVATDKTRDEKRGNAVGNVAKSVINGFIPFGGVIKEVTGAASKERQWQVALYAGASRRAFLKGYGQARGCRYPARAATAAQAAALQSAGANETAAAPPPPKKKRSGKRRSRR